MQVKAPRGTYDIMPDEIHKWHRMEQMIRCTAETFGYMEIRTPIFEHTELFERGVGDTTDIVSKEMYTFQDRSHRSLTLRPENTASCVRAFIEHSVAGGVFAGKMVLHGSDVSIRPASGRQIPAVPSVRGGNFWQQQSGHGCRSHQPGAGDPDQPGFA